MNIPTRRKLVINFVLLSGGEAVSKIFAFIAFAYLARILGPDVYGDLEFALAATLFFNLAVEGGLGLLGAREIAKDKESVSKLTFHIIVMRCILAVGSFLLLMVFTVLCNKSPQEKQLVILYGLTLFGTPGLLQWFFQGFDRMHWVAISSVLRWSLFAGVVLLYVKDPTRAWVVPLAELGAVGCVVFLNIGLFAHGFGKIWRPFNLPFAISLMRQAAPIGLTQVMWGLKIYLPTVMLGLLIGGEQVGWFGSAHRIVLALHGFVWMYYFNLYPSISRCSQQTPEALQQLAGKSIQMNAWAAVFVGAAGTLFADDLINIVYGTQYAEAVIGFKVLIWLLSFALISGHYMYILIAYNKQWLELLSAVCGGIASIIINVLLIPKYGSIGASLAVLCSETFIWSLNYYFVRREVIKIRFMTHLIKPLLAGAIMVAMLQIMPSDNFWIMGSASLILYGLGLLILQPNIIGDLRLLIMGKQ